MVPHCYGSQYFGANNDLQFIHMPMHYNAEDTGSGNEGENQEPPLTRPRIEEISNLLCACRRSGLDAANSLHIINRYLTSYCCKGGKNSAHWEKASRSLIDAYCSTSGNEGKTIRSVVSKIMLQVSGSMSMPRDQALFLAAKGFLKRSSHGAILKCSVTSAPIQDIAQAANGADVSTDTTSDSVADPKLQNSFTMKNIFRRYKGRGELLRDKTIYEYSAQCWKDGKDTVPQFFGYHTRPTWPMKETFAKWTLTLHRPWMHSPEETKGGHDNYVDALVEYLRMEDCHVPNKIWNEIMRVKRREHEVAVDESAAVSGVAGDVARAMSPTGDPTGFEFVQVTISHIMLSPPQMSAGTSV